MRFALLAAGVIALESLGMLSIGAMAEVLPGVRLSDATDVSAPSTGSTPALVCRDAVSPQGTVNTVCSLR